MPSIPTLYAQSRSRFYRFLNTMAPGIFVMLVVAIISVVINKWLISLASPMLIALLLGMLLRNVSAIRPLMEPGIIFSAKTILRAGVVLLGLKLSLPQIAHLGAGPLAVIAVTVVCTFCITLLLGRAIKVAHTTRLLTATGTSICGAAAVAGMSAVTQKQDENDDEVDNAAATAIASVTIFGTVGLLLFPVLARLMDLSPQQTGVWMGAAVHEVGQVVAAAGIAAQNSPAAELIMNTATVTKLGRVALLALLVAIVGVWEQRRATARTGHGAERGESPQSATKKPPIVPLFVVGFLIAVVVRSVVEALAGSPLTGSIAGVFGAADTLAAFLLTVAMGAMGAGVHLKTIISTGARALLLGALAAIVAGASSLAVTLWLV